LLYDVVGTVYGCLRAREVVQAIQRHLSLIGPGNMLDPQMLAEVSQPLN
jgi:hypothetical protein